MAKNRSGDTFEYGPVFEQLPGLFLILSPDLRILAVTDQYLEATRTQRKDVVHKGVFDAFPTNPKTQGTTSEGPVRKSLETALKRRKSDTTSVFKFEVQKPDSEGGGFDERYWKSKSVPVLNVGGDVQCVIQSVEDLTKFLLLKEAEETKAGVDNEIRERTERHHDEVMRKSAETSSVNVDLTATILELRQSKQVAKALFEDMQILNIEVNAAKDASEAANAAKSEFLSRMSHELRTPLNAVLGFAQLLCLQFQDPEITESADCIEKAGQHLLNLINEVLELSRLESEHLSVSIEPVDLGEAVNYALDLLRPIAHAAGVTVAASPYKTSVYVCADRQRLVQVLINLANNAIKYNKRGGTVDIDWEVVDNDRARINVHDTGIGIAEANKALLFQPFQRFGQTNVEGTGLGLVLSRRFAELMGGTLELGDSDVNGSTFVVELALSTAENLRGPSGPQGVVDEASLDGSPQTVLYIEDNLANMRLLERVFAQLPQVRLIPAMLGSLGVELAREHRPDLILLDLHLPDTTGESVLSRLKLHKSTASIPIIIVSADATTSQVERLKSMGAADYMTKPLNLKNLLAAVRHNTYRSVRSDPQAE